MLATLLAVGIAASSSSIQAPDTLAADGSNMHPAAPSATKFAVGPNPTFTWAPQHGENNAVQTAYELVVTQSHRQHGLNPTADDAIWATGKVYSDSPRVTYAGPALREKTYYSWTVRYYDQHDTVSPWSSMPAEFHFAPPVVKDPKWIASDPFSNATGPGPTSEPLNLFRTTFSTAKAPARATLYICGLGYSYATINGKEAGPQLLTTAPWSNNERRNGYTTFDVTSLVATGDNVVGVALGHGWRDTTKFRRIDPDNSKGDVVDKTFWAELHIVGSDGAETVAVSTASSAWTAAAGPVIADSVYDGETYNALLEQPGWDTPSFAPATPWSARTVSTDPPAGSVTPWSAPPVLLDRVIKPVGITQPYPGVFVVDFGVNVAGVAKLSNIKLAKGANVTMKVGEIMQHALLPDLKTVDPKLIYQGNLRTAKATDVYISKGDGVAATFYPRFTYHGGRFVQVTGLTSLSEDDIEYHHFHSANDMKSTATFKSATLSKIYAMGVGSQRSNAMTVQTDCDQRDERLGWMGDANLSGDSIALTFKANPFLLSYTKTMIDELNPDGSSVDTAPSVRYGGRPGDISWTPATIALPYAMYKVDGDAATAKTYMDKLLLHVSNIASQCKGAANATCPQKYGDWVPPNAPGRGQGPKPSRSYTSAFSYIDSVQKVGELAAATGDKATAAKLAAESTRLAGTFNKQWFNASTSSYDNGVMTTYTLPLHMGIVPSASKAAVQKNLLDRCMTTNKGHTDTGIIGFKFLFEQLAAMGRADDAMAVLEATDYPSIGFMGYNKYEPATENVWELWDAYTEGVGMNSRNHHMFSSYTKYLIENPGGVTQEASSTGFRSVTLKPAHVQGLSGATVTTETQHGVLNFTWERAGGLQCSRTPEDTVSELSCGTNGGTIKRVRFASFGRPTGGCGSFGVDAQCHVDVQSAVEQLCKGKASCSIPATVDAFGVPCTSSEDGAPHRLHVEVECTAPPAVHAAVSIPVTSTATLVLPVAGMSKATLATTNGEQLEQYDVQHTVDEHGREVVVAKLGSGNHHFSLAGAEPAIVVDAATAAKAATAKAVTVAAACPAHYHVNHVRFASFGNPVKTKGAVWTRGTCHLASAVSESEAACLGKNACTVTVDAARIAHVPHCDAHRAAAVLAIELECVADDGKLVAQL